MNAAMLKGKLREKSMTQLDAARGIGISLSAFNAKLNGTHREFSLGEVRALKNLLGLDNAQTEQIFSAKIILER